MTIRVKLHSGLHLNKSSTLTISNSNNETFQYLIYSNDSSNRFSPTSWAERQCPKQLQNEHVRIFLILERLHVNYSTLQATDGVIKAASQGPDGRCEAAGVTSEPHRERPGR